MHTAFEAIGTWWQIDIESDHLSISEKELLSLIQKEIEEYDRVFSRFRKDSLMWEISEQTGKFQLPEYSRSLLDLYQRLYSLTDERFTPLIGATLSDAGYDETYSLVSKELKPLPTWNESIEIQGTQLTTYKKVLLDFGAAGKGQLIDIIGDLLSNQGITSYCIDAGGDILYRGDTKLRIGLENPADAKQVIGVVSLENKSICGSAGNRRAWGGYHHIINPKTLQSPHHIRATWVIAESTMIADAISTSLFFTTGQKLLTEFQFEYFILYPDFTFEKSLNFPAELFIH